MVCKKRGIYGFLGTSWVPITLASRNINTRAQDASEELHATPATLARFNASKHILQ